MVLRMQRVRRSLVAACAVVASVAVLAGVGTGCGGNKTGVLRPNLAPHIQLTTGPVSRSTEFYSIPFSWSAYDVDGTVDSFQYTVDTIDTTWTGTSEHTQSVIFRASTLADSAAGLFTDWHTFYVKAIDNLGAESDPAFVTFNAKTIAPVTRFTSPTRVKDGDGFNSPIVGGPSIRLQWIGIDADGVKSKRPVAYYLTRLQTDSNNSGRWSNSDSLAYFLTGKGAFRGFIPQTFYTTRLDTTFNDLASVGQRKNWIFGIQAVDEAGAVEPRFLGPYDGAGGNAFFFQAQGNLQGPALGVFSVAIGFFTAQGISRDSSQYVFDRPIDLVWGADASEYGAEIDGYRWGVDVQDITNDADPGWGSGWTKGLTSVSGIKFTDHTAALHDIIVQARDTNGNVTTAIIRLTLVEFPLDQDALFVDDRKDEDRLAGNGRNPTDPEHQGFMTQVIGQALTDLGRQPKVDLFNTYPDPNELTTFQPKLTDLAHYRTVVWDAGSAAGGQGQYFYMVSVIPGVGPLSANVLAIYLEAGGNLILNGFRPIGQTVQVNGGPTNNYPLTSTGVLQSGDHNFALDYLHVQPPIYTTASVNGSTSDGLAAALPTAYARSHGFGAGFPPLELDGERWYKIAFTEATPPKASGPISYEGWSQVPATEDGDFVAPLYTAKTVGGPTGSQRGTLDGRYIGQMFKRRPRTTSEDWQYQVYFVTFPLYYYKADGVTGFLTNAFYDILNDKKWGVSRVQATPPANRPLPAHVQVNDVGPTSANPSVSR